MEKSRVMFDSLGREWRFKVGIDVMEALGGYRAYLLREVVRADPDHRRGLNKLEYEWSGAHLTGTLG